MSECQRRETLQPALPNQLVSRRAAWEAQLTARSAPLLRSASIQDEAGPEGLQFQLVPWAEKLLVREVQVRGTVLIPAQW